MFEIKTIKRGEGVSTRVGVVTWVSLDSNELYVRYIDTISSINHRAEVYYHPFTDAEPTIAGMYFYVGCPVIVITVGMKKYVTFSFFTIPFTESSDWFFSTDIRRCDGPGAVTAGVIDRDRVIFNVCGDNWLELFKNGINPGSLYPHPDTGTDVEWKSAYTFSTQQINTVYDEYVGTSEYVVWIQELQSMILKLWQGRTNSYVYPVRVVPNISSKYLSSVGWQWSTGTYHGLNSVYTKSFFYRGTQGCGGIFPTTLPTSRLIVDIEDEDLLTTSEYSLAIHPILSHEFYHSTSVRFGVERGLSLLPEDLYTKVATVDMPWRRASETPTRYNPCPELYLNPVETGGTSAQLDYGIVDQIDEIYHPVGQPEVDRHRYPSKFICGSVTMTPKAGKEGQLLSAGDYDYSHSYTTSEQSDVYTVTVSNSTNLEYYLNTYVHAGVPKRLPSQKFIVFTDGTNTIRKVPYIYYNVATGIFFFEVDYEWNGRTVITQSLHKTGISDATEEWPFFRQLDLLNGYMVADVRVVDYTEKTVKWERRLCEPGGGNVAANNYIVVFTYTPPTQPTASIPDIRNIPPWSLDPDFVPAGGHPSGTSYVNTPYFIAPYFHEETWAVSPASKDCVGKIGYPNLQQASNYFPGTVENICSCPLTCVYLESNTGATGVRTLGRYLPQPHVMATSYGWVANMPICWNIDYDDIVLNYDTTLLEKRNGVISGIDPDSVDNVLIPARKYDEPRESWDFVPEE